MHWLAKKWVFFPKNLNFGRTETYQGLAAQLWGGILIFLAIFPLVFAILNLTLKGGMVEFWAKLLDTNWGWGIILASIGLVVMTTGIIRFIAGSGGYFIGWQDRVEKITGIIPTLFGLSLVILGIILFLFPDQLITRFDSTINLFK